MIGTEQRPLMYQREIPAQPPVRKPERVRAYAAMNTVRALERLAFVAMSTTELAASLQVSVRTARRLLQRLELEGVVAQERGHRRRYRATLRLAALGRQMLDEAPLAKVAGPRVTRLAYDTSCIAHLWILGYDEHVVCAVHADGQACCVTMSGLCDVASASSSAAGAVLLRAPAELPTSCCVHQTAEPAVAAAVVERGDVVAALGLTGDRALDGTAAVVSAAAQLSADLRSRP